MPDIKTYPKNTEVTKICLLEIERCVTITGHEKIGGDKNSYEVIDARYLGSTQIMVYKNHN